MQPLVATLRQELQRVGYVEGRNVAIESPLGRGPRQDRCPNSRPNLVGRRVDVIATIGRRRSTAFAARNATSTIPIVFLGGAGDPVGSGLVANLARPSGNVTGSRTHDSRNAAKLLRATVQELRPLGLSDCAFLATLITQARASRSRIWKLRHRGSLLASKQLRSRRTRERRRTFGDAFALTGRVVVHPAPAPGLRRRRSLASPPSTGYPPWPIALRWCAPVC